jgi:hypothetical protein
LPVYKAFSTVLIGTPKILHIFVGLYPFAHRLNVSFSLSFKLTDKPKTNSYASFSKIKSSIDLFLDSIISDIVQFSDAFTFTDASNLAFSSWTFTFFLLTFVNLVQI